MIKVEAENVQDLVSKLSKQFWINFQTNIKTSPIS